jgi:hypothetical protein
VPLYAGGVPESGGCTYTFDTKLLSVMTCNASVIFANNSSGHESLSLPAPLQIAMFRCSVGYLH